MTWKAYRHVYRAMSPIHIGWHTLGYIKLTRHYIPGKTVWGAMTANLTRTYGPENIETYEAVGALLRTDVRISYFYPAIDWNNCLMPQYTDSGLIYGDINRDHYLKDEFESLFVGSFGQTAILPQSNTAEDESLHESEYIVSAINEDGECKQVFFVGYLFVKEGASLNGQNIITEDGRISITPAIRELFVGGDSKYGWGRLKLSNNPENEEHQTGVFRYEFTSEGGAPCIRIPEGSSLPAHLKIESGMKVKGDIEPVVGRDWGDIKDSQGREKSGAGQRVSKANICWVPGSVMAEQVRQTLRIGEFGILE